MPTPAASRPLRFRGRLWFALGLLLSANVAWQLRAQDSAPAVDATTWARLAGNGELEGLVDRLRQAGCPPVIIRAIVFERLQQPFANRIRAVCSTIETNFFWRTPQAMEPKVERLRYTLSRELSDAARALLGPGADELSDAERAMYRRQYGELPLEKIDLMQRVLGDYRDLIKLASIDTPMLAPLAGARETLALLDRELRSDLDRLFTPAELDGYARRMSRAAQGTRFELAPLAPTEAEFLAVYRIHKSVDDRFGESAAGLTPAQIRERNAAQSQISTQIAAALGPARFAEYQRANAPGPHSRVPPRPPSPVAPVMPTHAPPGSAWAALEDAELATTASRLRFAGFPAATIRAILMMRLNERQVIRELREIYGGDGHTYWLDDPGYRLDTPEKQTAERAIVRERSDAMHQLFGSDIRVLEPVPLAYQRRIFGPLPAEKIAQLLELFDRATERQETAGASAAASSSDEEQRATDAEIAKVLTPAELEGFSLGRGRMASHLFHTVVGFSGTRVEFEAVSRIYRPLAAMLNAEGFVPPERTAEFTAAEQAAESSLRAALGEERFADFQQAKHGNRVVNEIVLHLDLPIKVAREVETVASDVSRRASALYNEPGASPAERDAKKAAFAREATTRLTELLGDHGFDLYLGVCGQWLTSLQTSSPR